MTTTTKKDYDRHNYNHNNNKTNIKNNQGNDDDDNNNDDSDNDDIFHNGRRYRSMILYFNMTIMITILLILLLLLFLFTTMAQQYFFPLQQQQQQQQQQPINLLYQQQKEQQCTDCGSSNTINTTLKSTIIMSSSSSTSSTSTLYQRRRMNHGWIACYPHDNNNNINNKTIKISSCHPNMNHWNVRKLPTTAMMELLFYQEEQQRQQTKRRQKHQQHSNHSINYTNKNHHTKNHMSSNNNNDMILIDPIYYSTNLITSTLPDISIVGRKYYTLLYQYDIQQMNDTMISSTINTTNTISFSNITDNIGIILIQIQTRKTIRFPSINYRATAYIDDQIIPEIGLYHYYYENHNNKEYYDDNDKSCQQQYHNNNTNSIQRSMDGMFHRRSYDITYSQTNFAIYIEPPLHPGTCFTNISTTTKSTTTNRNKETTAFYNIHHNHNTSSSPLYDTYGEKIIIQSKRRQLQLKQKQCRQRIYDDSPSNNNVNNNINICHGQGGNHELSIDGPISQYMLGWDWCQSIPDRNTGFYGNDITIEYTGPISILDPTIHTQNIYNCSQYKNKNSNNSSNHTIQNLICEQINITIMARMEIICHNNSNNNNNNNDHYLLNDPNYNMLCNNIIQQQNTNVTLLIESDWNESWTIDFIVNMSNSTSNNNGTIEWIIDLQQDFMIQKPDKVHLWWPHNVGILEVAYLHTFQFTVMIHSNINEETNTDNEIPIKRKTHNNNHGDLVNRRIYYLSDQMTLKTGIRTVETYLNETLNGQIFLVNGYRIYLVGGNWIGTDQLFRHQYSTKRRYWNELLLHKTAGINLIRVWGGSVSETNTFYECANELGILIYQEFWMTGDNNGRWAGNDTSPYNYDVYLYNVEDTIRRLRSNPSLLFYVGCNECLTKERYDVTNPPKYIDHGIRNAINKYDPNRFYISSSMGGYNKADTFYDPIIAMNRSYSLSYTDGPYQLLFIHEYFEMNPGLIYKNFTIGFQPEIGSTNTPTYQGLLRFMNINEVNNGYPKRNSDIVGETWDFHRYQSWIIKNNNNNNGTILYDTVYAYYSESYPMNASEWCAAAQLVSHQQNMYLFNGYITNIFHYTSGIIYWKSQSPWPSLRGFLYDWYLETTGGWRGVKSSLCNPISITYNPLLKKLHLVNRRIFPIVVDNADDNNPLNNNTNNPATSIGAEYSWITMKGDIILTNHVWYTENNPIAIMSSVTLGTDNETITWPVQCSVVCFLRVRSVIPQYDTMTSWYWLTDPTLSYTSNYSELGEMRRRQNANVQFAIHQCILSKNGKRNGIKIIASLEVNPNSTEILFYPTFSLYHSRSMIPILPLYDDGDTNIVLLPGETQNRTLESPIPIVSSSTLKGDHHEFDLIMTSWNAFEITKRIRCIAATR